MGGGLPILYFPLAGALTGWAAAYVSLRALFRPRRPVRFLGLTFQGLIPRRKKETADRLAEVLCRELSGEEGPLAILARADCRAEAERLIDRLLEKTAALVLPGGMPLIGNLVEVFLGRAKALIAGELADRLEEHRLEFAARFSDHEKLKKMILARADSLGLGDLEITLEARLWGDLAAISALGGLVGLAMGSLFALAKVLS